MTPGQILQQLREARQAAGLSMHQLARDHGVHAATLRSHETGERAFTLEGLVEHAGWLDLEVVLLPAGGAGAELYQRGFDQAVTQVAELFGLPVDAEAMRRHNEPRPMPVDWDAELADAQDELATETLPQPTRKVRFGPDA